MPHVTMKSQRIAKRYRKNDTPSVTQKTGNSAKIDIALSRTANASQLGLVLLAFFGYFYTVIPAYQKSLLDEEIAQKTITLNEKNIEIKNKQRELKRTNKELLQYRENAQKSLTEIDQLKKSKHRQYAELRPRLIMDFENLSVKFCSLDKISSHSLTACIKKNVLSSQNLSALKKSDRALLLSLVHRDSKNIETSWSQFIKNIKAKEKKLEQRKSTLLDKCTKLKSSKEYQDKNKMLLINYQCSIDEINIRSDETKIYLDKYYNARDFLRSRLSYIEKEFFRAP